MAFEGHAVSVSLICSATLADCCDGMFQELVDSIKVVKDPGNGFVVMQDSSYATAYFGGKRVFTGIARVRENGNGKPEAYLKVPGGIIVKKNQDTIE